MKKIKIMVLVGISLLHSHSLTIELSPNQCIVLWTTAIAAGIGSGIGMNYYMSESPAAIRQRSHELIKQQQHNPSWDKISADYHNACWAVHPSVTDDDLALDNKFKKTGVAIVTSIVVTTASLFAISQAMDSWNKRSGYRLGGD